jgi:flagellar biosynthesis/type III secretory pathway chaperone
MRDPIERLVEILGREIGIYAELLEVKFGEKEALLKFSTRDLEEFNERQNVLAGRAADLEFQRVKLVREMAKARGAGGTPTLSEVAGWLSGESRASILELGDELADLCEKLAVQQGANAELIDTSAHYLRELVENLVRRSQLDRVAYTQRGVKTPGRETNPSLIDRTL